MNEKEQAKSLSEKFLTVVQPIFASKSESSILSLFSSLPDICYDLLVPKTDSDGSSHLKTTELTCWLLNQLLLIQGSAEVRAANFELQLHIFQLIGTHNVNLFRNLLKDFVKIGLEGANILFDGGRIEYKPFSSVIEIKTAELMPKILEITDDDELDELLINIIRILSKLSSYILLYYSDHMNSVWMLVGLCLEAGDVALKSVALKVFSELLAQCLVPQSIETQDYLLQLIDGCFNSLLKGELISSSEPHKDILDKFQENLSLAILSLQNKILEFSSIVSLNFLIGIGEKVNHSQFFCNINKNLIIELCHLCNKLLKVHKSASQYRWIQAVFQSFYQSNIHCVEIVEPCLKRVFLEELTHSSLLSNVSMNSENINPNEKVIISMSSISTWWCKLLYQINVSLKQIDIGSEEERTKELTLVILYLTKTIEVISEIDLHKGMELQFFSEDDIVTLTNIVVKKIFNSENVEQILQLLINLTFLVSKSRNCVSSFSIYSQYCFIWAALASFPWLSGEKNLLDLSPVDLKKYVTSSSSCKWKGDAENVGLCIGILALLPKSIAPKWRCRIVTIIVSQRKSPVLLNLVKWFPVFINNLGIETQPLLSEVYGVCLSFSDENILKSLSHSFHILFCAISQHTELSKKFSGFLASDCLKCCICEPSKNRFLNPQSVKIDQSFVLRFFPLLNHSSSDVVFNFAKSLAPIVKHCSISNEMFTQISSLLSHSESQIVDAFCENISILYSSMDTLVHLNEFVNILLKYIENIITDKNLPAADNKSISNKSSALKALEYVVCTKTVPSDKHGTILTLILHCLTCKNREIVSYAHILIDIWAKECSLTPKDLYLKNRRQAALTLAQIIEVGEINDVMSHLAHVFQWSHGVKSKSAHNYYNATASFVTSQLRFLLPSLVLRSMKDSKPALLQELSSCVGNGLRDTLIDNFQYILSYLVFHCSSSEKETVLQYVSTTTDIDINNIRRCSVQSQVNELVLGLYNYKKAVLSEFIKMRQLEFHENPTSSSEDAIRQFLSPRLLGILGFLDGKCISSISTASEKKWALLSLSDLLTLMGQKHISPVARKVLATLKAFQKIKEAKFQEACSSALMAFLKNLDESSLENMVEEILLLILSLTKEIPDAMTPVLEIVFKVPSVKQILGHLPLFPDIPSLHTINSKIKEQQLVIAKKASENVADVLNDLLKGLSHDSLDVRINNASRLRDILKGSIESIHNLILNSDKADPLISEIYNILLLQCRENNEELQLLLSECLGLLGAVDPSRLGTKDKTNELANKVHISMNSAAFVADLIMEISRAFLSATNPNTQTCALYAMQEILKIYEINLDILNAPGKLGYQVWRQLPENVKELLEPLFNSKYKDSSKRGKLSESNIPSPVFGSKYSLLFLEWLASWCCSLINCLSFDSYSKLFLVCKPIMKRDTNAALYLLPYLIISVLSESSDNHHLIMTEILAVFSDDWCLSSQGKNETTISGNETFTNIKSSNKGSISSKEKECCPTKEIHNLAVQTIFKTLDHLNYWVQQISSNSTLKQTHPGFDQVLKFYEEIPTNLLAKTSFHCQSYSRSLLYMETYLNKHPDKIKEHLGFLQSIYVALDEPDGVAGIAAIRHDDPSLKEQIIQHEANGRLQDALGCYERLCIEESSTGAHEGLLKCYLNLGQPQSVLNISQGLMTSNNDTSLNEYRVEAAWRLGQWDQLDNFLKTEENFSSWGVGIGEILNAARSENYVKYKSAMNSLRINQMLPLSALTIDRVSYQRSYPHIIKLHLLNELDEMVSHLLKIFPSKPVREKHNTFSPPYLNINQFKERWNHRLSLIQTSHRFLEPVLSFRRTLLKFGHDWVKNSEVSMSTDFENELKVCWLQSAKVSRKAGHLQPGERAFLGTSNSREVFVERAKWYWLKGDHHQAVVTLKRGIDIFYPNYEDFKNQSNNEFEEERRSYAEAKLLLAKYSEDSATSDFNTIKSYYRNVCDINVKSEDAHFNMAMYYDRIWSTVDEKKAGKVDWLAPIVQCFGKSLNYGCKHIYQSMPRLLAIWLDYGTRVANSKDSKSFSELNRMNSYIESITNILPPYMFLIALPQLMSRICHSHDAVFQVLRNIIAKILSNHPQQAMWHMIAVSKSSYKMRMKRCQEIFDKAKYNNPELVKFISDTTKLSDLLIELSNKGVERGVTICSLNRLLRSLPRLLTDPNFSKIILPRHGQMSVVLPSVSGYSNLQQLSKHNPFPNSPVYLTGIDDKVEVMVSLQKPKKLTFQGSDGNKYIMMCKPKDDLRKDCRLMDFTTFVNRLLLKDPESRKRNLHIRTYTVVPLNDECGLIEWVPNLQTIRSVLTGLYKESNQVLKNTEVRDMCNKLHNRSLSLDKRREVFVTKLLARQPSILHKWFLKTFKEPQAWLNSRLSYCRTSAVMSMVGYILGLGDRHLENILIDSSSGDIVHVDFNCLFNRGESFEIPEVVPFRLTHNLTAAMGPTGAEGVYRKACEVTMRVMHEQKDALMSVLRPFIDDPLVEWEKGKNIAKSTGEVSNEEAQRHAKEIESRLRGCIHRGKTRAYDLPLSVEGQVNVLIKEATDLDNLCRMYIGWAAYL